MSGAATLDVPVFGLSGLPDLIESDARNLAGQSDEETGREHLSHSALSSLLACGQKYGFSYDMAIQSKAKPRPLSMGKAFQAAIEHRDPAIGIEMVVTESGPIFSQEDEDRRRVEGAIVGAAAAAYLARWTPAEDSQREFEYRVQLRNPWTGAYSRTFDLLGFADELDWENGEPVLIENKLVGQIGALNIRKLPLDRQIALACYGIWRATGETVTRVRYRWTRKPSIRQKQSETVEQFCERITADYEARGEDFYTHEEVLYRSTNDLVRVEAELWEWAEQVRQSRKRNLWARNTSHCHEYGGCQFLAICCGDPDAGSLYEPKSSNNNNTPEES